MTKYVETIKQGLAFRHRGSQAAGMIWAWRDEGDQQEVQGLLVTALQDWPVAAGKAHGCTEAPRTMDQPVGPPWVGRTQSPTPGTKLDNWLFMRMPACWAGPGSPGGVTSLPIVH